MTTELQAKVNIISRSKVYTFAADITWDGETTDTYLCVYVADESEYQAMLNDIDTDSKVYTYFRSADELTEACDGGCFYRITDIRINLNNETEQQQTEK